MHAQSHELQMLSVVASRDRVYDVLKIWLNLCMTMTDEKKI